MEWRISIQPLKEPVSELKITDTFPNDGLILLEDTLVVRKGGVALEKGLHYTIIPVGDAYNQGFVLEFLETGLPLDREVTISYKTSFDPEEGIFPNTDEGRVYRNRAVLEGKTASNAIIDVTVNASRTLLTEAWNAGKKEGRRVHQKNDAQETGWDSGYSRLIEWDLYINYLEQNLGDTVSVIDTWNYEGAIVPGSLVVRNYDVRPNGATVIGDPIGPDKYEVTFEYDDSIRQWRIDFTDSVSDRIVVSFLTEVPERSQEVYRNDADVFLSEGGDPLPYSSSVSYAKATDFLDKEAVQFTGSTVFIDDELFWRITVNESLSVISGAEIEDTISAGMVLLQGSLEIYSREQGEAILLIEGEDYAVTFGQGSSGGTTINISFLRDISTEIAVEYRTVVVSDSGTVNNAVVFRGENIQEVSKTTEELNARQFTFVGGTTDPRKGKIMIQKQDGATGEPVDAVFELYYFLNDEERIIGTEAFSTENGRLEFNNLSFRTYFLREVTPPVGYENLSEEIEIFLDRDDPSPNYNASTRTKTVTVDNLKLGTLNLLKVDRDNPSAVLAGARFLLRHVQSGRTFSLETDANGEAAIDGLALGTYALTETQFPEGYMQTDQTVTFDIGWLNGEDETPVYVHHVDLTLENDRLRQIEILKYDLEDETKMLSGAVFQLRDADGGLVGQLTTDEQGRALIGELAFGGYLLIETTAPSGYLLNTNPIFITLNRETIPGDTITINVGNERRGIGGQIPGGGDPVPAEPPVVNLPQPERPDIPDQEKTTDQDEPTGGDVDVSEGGIPSISEPPKHGTVEIDEDGQWTYTPDPGFSGKDVFTIVIRYPDGTEETVVIEIDVIRVPVRVPAGEEDQIALPKTEQRALPLFYAFGIVFPLTAALWGLTGKKRTYEQ